MFDTFLLLKGVIFGKSQICFLDSEYQHLGGGLFSEKNVIIPV